MNWCQPGRFGLHSVIGDHIYEAFLATMNIREFVISAFYELLCYMAPNDL